MSITEASNYITHQHNTLSGWLYDNLCIIYKALNGTCASTIGPLQENQVHVPIELYWPEGQLNMIEKIDQMQSSLSPVAPNAFSHENDEIVYANVSSVSNLKTIKSTIDALSSNVQEKVDALSGEMQNKVDTIESKVDAMQDDLKELNDIVESKVDELKEMMSKLMGMMAN